MELACCSAVNHQRQCKVAFNKTLLGGVSLCWDLTYTGFFCTTFTRGKKNIWRPACELFQWLSSWVWYGKSPRKGWTCVVLNREGCCLPLSPLPAEQQSVWLWLCSLIQQWHRVTMGVLWPRLLGPDCLTSCLTSENLKGNDFGFTAQSSFKLLPWTW